MLRWFHVTALLLSVLLLSGCDYHSHTVDPAHAYWQDAGILFVAGPAPGSLRVLHARAGSMDLVGDVVVAPGSRIEALRLDPSGQVLWAYTEQASLALDAASLARPQLRRAQPRVAVIAP